ncbi:MAG: NAD(P)H-dependent oxidoreductase [Aurantimonas endophytica]|uniref:NAD(P)H-dependent FMN reductase n=1 Tax=Aurantimonas endophytica TaxID=1522175 RepID=A0A7W6HGU8_9HYPH|nr:NAD(P)H-dependent oxidoreductase [Aurantimonas endophytica]MBB4004946.1 NAD(P)H-dependent FMN reductase [Aurantimonas endophytica]MCO6405753.1 NADPH-dependent FMN reductase [Aurantimonas endophytica]
MSLLVPVILGSVRSERQGIKAANFIIAKLRERGHEPVLVDPMELDLPLLDKMYKEYPRGEAPEKLERLADLYRRADGFMIVSAEYNQSIPAALKNTLDYFLEEYFYRPSSIVCYSAGRFGGVRAAIALRPVLAEMGMSSLPSVLAIPSIGKSLQEDGTSNEPWIDRSAVKFLDEFEWYATALKAKRDADGVPQ